MTEFCVSFPLPKCAYKTRLSVEPAKKDDLMKMLAKNIIPNDYRSYYEDLPAREKAVKQKNQKNAKKNLRSES